jgi:hypothetical protein
MKLFSLLEAYTASIHTHTWWHLKKLCISVVQAAAGIVLVVVMVLSVVRLSK